MRIIYYLALMLLAMPLINGCPSDEVAGDDNGAIAESIQSSAVEQPAPVSETAPETAAAATEDGAENADALVQATAEDEPQAVEEDDTAATEDAGTDAGSGIFDLTGLKIGLAPPAYRLYYDTRPEIQLFPTWIEQNTTGLVAANMANGSVSFGEVAYFLDSELVGVMRHVEEAAVNYADFTNGLERRFGPPTDEPPRWARVTPFFATYQKPDPGLLLKYWGNSQTREVFFAARNNTLSTTDYMLCDVDRFDIVAQQVQGLGQ